MKLLALFALLLPTAAWAQGAVQQVGPGPQGHMPVYSSPGFGATQIQDMGAAGGPGIGAAEYLQINRATGTGPFNSHNCMYGNPPGGGTPGPTNQNGYYFLCLDADAATPLGPGGLISFGAGGLAPQIPLVLNINGENATFGGSGTLLPALPQYKMFVGNAQNQASTYGPATLTPNLFQLNFNAVTPSTSLLANSNFQFVAPDGATAGMELDSFGGTGLFEGVCAAGTGAAPQAVQSGANCLALRSWQYNGAQYVRNGGIVFASAENQSPGHAGSQISFWTTPNGSSTAVDVMHIGNQGGLVLPASVTGGSQGAGTMNVSGGYYVNGLPVPTLLGKNQAPLPPPFAGTALQISAPDGVNPGLDLYAFGGVGASFRGACANGTGAIPSAFPQAVCTRLQEFLYDGANWIGPLAAITMGAAEQQSVGHGGSYVDVMTTLIGTTTEADVLRFENNGGITIPSTVTGGNKGPGTLNSQGGYFVQGNPVLTLKSPQNPVSPLPIGGTILQISGLDNVQPGIELNSFGVDGTNALVGAPYRTTCARGTGAAPSALLAGDSCGRFNSYFYNGANYVLAARITMSTSELQTGTHSGSQIDIQTTPNGTTTPQIVTRFGNDGGISVPASVLGGDLGSGTINAMNLFIQGHPVPPLLATNPNPLPTPGTGAIMQLSGPDGTAPTIEVYGFGGAPGLRAFCAGGTGAAPSGVLIGSICSRSDQAFFFNGASYVGPLTNIRALAAENQTSGHGGTAIDFMTTPIGQTTEAEVLKLENDGGITVPGNVSGGDMGPGTVNVSGGYFVNGTRVPSLLAQSPGPLPPPLTGTVLQLGGPDGNLVAMELDAFGPSGVALQAVCAGGTAAVPTPVLQDASCGRVQNWFYNGVSYVQGAKVSVHAAENQSVGHAGSYILLQTVPVGSTTIQDVVRIQASGGLTMPPTVAGGDPGLGAINAQDLRINGVSVASTRTTFTPTLTADGGGTPTYNLGGTWGQIVGAQGSYTVYARVALTGVGTLAGANLRIAGLPISQNPAFSASCAIGIVGSTVLSTGYTQFGALIPTAGNFINLEQFGSNVPFVNLNASALTATSVFSVNCRVAQ